MSFYDDASWLLIPSGIEEDIVFAQKPISGLGDLTFTRASDATYTDASGVVRRSPYNLFQQSEMFSNAIWGKINSTIGIDATVAPNGTLTADLLTNNTTNGLHQVFQDLTLIANTYTLTCYAKANTLNFVGLYSGANTQGAFFNLTNGTVSGNIVSAPTSSSAINVGNGWYRLSITITIPAASARFQIILSEDGTSFSYAGTNKSAFIWGAQLVEGSSSLDYFPTTNRQDVPRIDFRNADGTLSSCGRLLLEPQRTNSMLHSENVASALTTQANTTVTANTGVSPDGNTTADTILFALSSYRLRAFTIAASTSYSASLFFKNINFAGTETIQLNVSDGVYGPITATIQPANGTATFTRNTSGWSSVSGVVQDYGNGWYRVAVSGTSIGGGSGWYEISSQVSKSALFWGLQFEQSAAYPTTYIPTTTAAVTRLADTASKTGVSSLIGQTEGTLFVEFSTANLESYTRRVFSLSDGTNSNQINLQIQASTTTLTFAVLNGAAAQAVINTSTNFYTLGSTIKIAVAYKANDFAFYANGNQIGVDTSGTVPTCSQFRFSDPLNSNNFIGGVSQYALFPTRLPNAQLAQLTTL